PSSNVDWEAGEIELLAEAVPWEAVERTRRAGVSSFGISVTNAHVILEEAPASSQDAQDQEGGGEPLPGPLPLVLSAKSEPALREGAANLAAHLRRHPELSLTDLAYSLATTRSAFEQRAALVGSSPEQVEEALEALAAGKPSPALTTAKATPGRLAYLFTGQGSQRAGMGRELYETYPPYKRAFEAACEAIDPELGESLGAIVFQDDARLAHTTYAQPAIFATEVALFHLLASFGLEPELLAGHSIGEIAAAHLAGVFSLSDAAKLIVARGALMGELPTGGAMLALQGTEAEVLAASAETGLSLAAVNSPNSSVLSGPQEAIAEIEASWQEQGRKTKRLE